MTEQEYMARRRMSLDPRRKSKGNLGAAATAVGGLGAAGLALNEMYPGKGKRRFSLNVPKSNAAKLEKNIEKKFQANYKGPKVVIPSSPKIMYGTGLTGLKNRVTGVFKSRKNKIKGMTPAQQKKFYAQQQSKIEALEKAQTQGDKKIFKAVEKSKPMYRVRRGANEALRKMVGSLKRNPKAWLAGGAAAALGGRLLAD